MFITYLEALVLSGSSSILWSLLTELQIIEHFNLFRLKQSPTWSTFSDHFDGITNLEFLDTE